MAQESLPKITRADKVRENTSVMPGFHLSDWMRLSGALGNKQLRKIGMKELKEHSSQYDCWTAYKGKVYDVTQYLAYHPGGVKKLMLGAGKDCTALYNKYHAWVNAETMLAKCMIGILVDDDDTAKPATEEIEDDSKTTKGISTVSAGSISAAFETSDNDLDVDGINIIQLQLQPKNEKVLSTPVIETEDEHKQTDDVHVVGVGQQVEDNSITSNAAEIPAPATTITAREAAMMVDDKKTPTDKES